MSSNTVTLIYTGRHGAVDVPLPNGHAPTVRWGDEFVTTAEHAASLLEQEENWQLKPKRTRAAAATSKSPTEKEK